MPDESTLRERLEELEGAMQNISYYTVDPWVRKFAKGYRRMTEVERKALSLINEEAGYDYIHARDMADKTFEIKAFCRAIEQHEAFKQEVSDTVHKHWGDMPCEFDRFIIPKPVDPLVTALRDTGFEIDAGQADCLRNALAKHGLEIRSV